MTKRHRHTTRRARCDCDEPAAVCGESICGYCLGVIEHLDELEDELLEDELDDLEDPIASDRDD